MGDNQSKTLRTLVIKTEGASQGTDAVPTTDNHTICFRNVEIQPNIEMSEDSKCANGSHAESPSIAGIKSAQITADVWLAHSGTDETAPPWFEAFKPCGCGVIGWDGDSAVAEGSAADGVALVRRTAYDDASYTAYVIESEIGSSPVYTIYKVAGLMGNVTISQEIGKPAVASFTYTGKLNDIADGSNIALNSGMSDQVAEAFVGQNFTIGGTSAKVQGWSLDLGNEVTPIYNQNDATGISHYIISSSKPRFSCNPLAVKQATTDWLNIVNSETLQAIKTRAAATGKLQVHVLQGQCMSPALAEREGLVSWDLNFKACQNGTPGDLADTDLTLEDTIEILHGTRT